MISFHFTSFRSGLIFIIFFGLYCVWNQSKFEFWSNVKNIYVTKNQNGSRHQTSGDPFFDLLVKVRLRRKIQKNRRHKMDINRWCEEIYVSNKYEGIFRATKESSFCDIWFRFEKFSFLFFSPVIPLLVPICRSCWMICNFENLKSSAAKITKYLFWVNIERYECNEVTETKYWCTE